MRVAAVALVLIVGAAVVLAFANTLNSWVLGGLLGGLAAILLSIPISLAIFTLLARRQEARQRATVLPLSEEPEFADDDEMYDEARVVYEAEGYVVESEEDLSANPRVRYRLEGQRPPVSGYLSLPPARRYPDSYAEEDEDLESLVRREPRNYPRQPRHPARALDRDTEIRPQQSQSSARRHPSTRSLAQHQSAALRRARQEAQQRQRSDNQRDGSGSFARRPQENRPSSTQRPRTSRDLRPASPSSGMYRPTDDYDTRVPGRRGSAWNEDDDFTDDFSTEELQWRASSRQYPRQPGYPRRPRSARSMAADPWTGDPEEEDEDAEEPRGRRPRHDPDRVSGSVRNPLVRRAPYLYDDDPMSEEFARQLDPDHPIARRSTRRPRYEDEEEY